MEIDDVTIKVDNNDRSLKSVLISDDSFYTYDSDIKLVQIIYDSEIYKKFEEDPDAITNDILNLDLLNLRMYFLFYARLHVRDNLI